MEGPGHVIGFPFLRGAHIDESPTLGEQFAGSQNGDAVAPEQAHRAPVAGSAASAVTVMLFISVVSYRSISEWPAPMIPPGV